MISEKYFQISQKIQKYTTPSQMPLSQKALENISEYFEGLNRNIPEDYLLFLTYCNGFEINQIKLFDDIEFDIGIDYWRNGKHYFSLGTDDWHPTTPWFDLGCSEVSWFAFSTITKKYVEIDMETNELLRIFLSFEDMLSSMLEQSLRIN